MNRLSLVERTCLRILLNQYNNREIDTINIRHQKKLFNLWHTQVRMSPECIKNISHRQLKVHEINALQFGLKHHILPKRFNIDNVKINIERCINNVLWKKI